MTTLEQHLLDTLARLEAEEKTHRHELEEQLDILAKQVSDGAALVETLNVKLALLESLLKT